MTLLPITSRKAGRTIYPNEVLLPAGVANLERESIVLCYQIRTLDKARLHACVGNIESTTLQESIVEAMRFQLAI